MLLIIEALLIVAALGEDHRAAVEKKEYPLDMAPDSVDDLYYGCGETMADLVEDEYLEKEKEYKKFEDAWKNAKAKISIWKFLSKLKRIHKIAIRAYTDNGIYSEFNLDTRTGKQNYKYYRNTNVENKYKWYSLHFLLTEAIQFLKKKQNRCFDTFRGTNADFNHQSGDVRFGSFASSSLDQNKAKNFGTKSCFEIHTCEGAEVTKYSEFPGEKEVLIPPYEKFKVTAVKKKINDPDLWCDTVYILESSGIRSDLNCALFSDQTKT